MQKRTRGNPYRGSTSNPVGRELFNAWRSRRNGFAASERDDLRRAAEATLRELADKRLATWQARSWVNGRAKL